MDDQISVRTLRDLTLAHGYSTGAQDLIDDFYVPCLDASTFYHRAVGYFRGTLFVLVGVAFSEFARRGGSMKLICSPNLSPADIEALKTGYAARDVITDSIRSEIETLLADSESRVITEFLATLVAYGTLDLRLAYRETAAGIFHSKLGIFGDQAGNVVTFVGSANETFSAWSPTANHESFEVFESWHGGSDSLRTARHVADFDELWSKKKQPGLVVRDFPDAIRNHLIQAAGSKGLDNAAAQVRQIVLSQRSARNVRDTLRRLPAARSLQPHQSEVVQSWFTAHQRGIIAHATGSGKTVAAISIIRRWINDSRPVLVVVPTELLATQWRDEIAAELANISPAILIAGAGHGRRSWQDDLADFTRDMAELGPRVVIATLATAASDLFLNRIRGGDHLLVVADEVHRIGSRAYQRILDIAAGGRLGLSATPERYGDPDGTAVILGYFGRVLAPKFDISDAVAAGRLVPYDYFVHQVALSQSEQAQWENLTVLIQREFVRLPKRADQTREPSQRFNRLLFQRAAILKGAKAKVRAAVEVVKGTYRDRDRWLLYCDSLAQLNQLVAALKAAQLQVDEYHSAMEGDGPATLSGFVRAGGILVAIRCLDEGVDIPSVNRAVILASSRNSREFVQRRGRLLRAAPGKYSAEIHDLLVVPSPSLGEDGNQRVIVRGELQRAAIFAQNARNRAVLIDLQSLAESQGLTDFDILTDESEED